MPKYTEGHPLAADAVLRCTVAARAGSHLAEVARQIPADRDLLPPAFWLIARFSGSALEMTLVLFAVGHVHRNPSEPCQHLPDSAWAEPEAGLDMGQTVGRRSG